MNTEKDKTITNIKRSHNINVGIIIFFILIIYIAIMVIRSMTRVPITATEVEAGKIVDSSLFTGIAIRNEEVVNSPYSGYLNFYINDGDRVAKNSNVCLIDTSGNHISDALNNDQIKFTAKDYDDIEQLISVYTNSYTNSKFSDIYTFKYDLQNKITEIISKQVISNIGDSTFADYSLKNITAPESGIVSYSYDGMENLTVDDINDDLFNYAKYENHQLTSSEKVEVNTPAFKLTKDSSWSIIIKVNKTQASILSKEGVIKVRFTKDDISTWAYVNIFYNGDSSYAELKISRYMVRYLNDRYLEIELVSAEKEGLKIPTSSIATKDFYTIPQSYLITEAQTDEKGFYKYTYSENGELQIELIKPTIYKIENDLCYVDLSEFNLGDYIGDGIQHEGQYRIGATDSVYGVYNINQGYTLFRIVNILYQNDDYSIVEKNTPYGIALYDHIVLNAESVKDEQIIY